MGVLIGLLVITCGVAVFGFAFETYIDSRYADTLTATYEYRVTVVTDAPLSDLHLFLPLPVRRGASSAVVQAVGARQWTEIPEGWNVTLTGTQKYNLLEVNAPLADTTEGCSACGISPGPHVLTIPATVTRPIDVRDPAVSEEVLEPRRAEAEKACTGTDSTGDSTPRCTSYETRFFADYTTYPATTVVITVELVGTNRWNIFSDRYSQFRDTASLTVLGESHGWQSARGVLETGLGYSSLW